jgi:hypothetical protein
MWLPEAVGPVEAGSGMHQALMTVLGAQAQREVVRARHRVLAAMRVQAAVQGRYMGGRPAYGYRLVDAGPHPNRAHASWGGRLHRLEADPATATVVWWIFAVRRAGSSVSAIARQLNERGVPCPSRADRAHNPHRSGAAWMVRTVASILENPRYTGRQVWNRQRTDSRRCKQPVLGATTATGSSPTALCIRRWSPRPISWLFRPYPPTGRPRMAAAATIGCPGWSSADHAGGAWTRTGSTSGLATGAGTDTPAPRLEPPTSPETSTSEKTTSSTTSQPAWTFQTTTRSHNI